MSKKYDGMVILDRVIPLYGESVYGLYINIDDEINNQKRDKQKSGIEGYIIYLFSVSQFLKSGGEISDDHNKWTHAEYNLDISYNTGMKIFLKMMFDGMVGFKIVPIDPVDYEDDCIITDPSVIERYSTREPIKIGGDV